MLQFLNWPDRYSFAGIFFRAYDLLQIWSICITAIGLAALFELRARVIGFGLVTTFTVALLVFAGFVTVATGPQKGRSLRHGSAGSPIGAVSPLLTSDGV